MKEFIVNQEHELAIAAKYLADLSAQIPVLIFNGQMGAGKTTLIKQICKFVGVTTEMNSPTYAIVNEYFDGEKPVYHFDCYRLKNLQEALDIGAEEYFFSGNQCFVEWPEIILPILPDRYINITIALKDNLRIITIN